MKWTKTKVSRVYDSVTNNNGVSIGWLDLLTPSFTITRNRNQLHELTINLQTNPSPLTRSPRSTTVFCYSRSHVTTGGQSASLSWCQAPIYGLHQILFFTVRQLRICWCGALSLKRRRVCVHNSCWPSPAQSFLGPSPAGLVTIFYCLRFETPPTWRARFRYLYPRHCVPL
jgi:hypothetical protein